MLQLQNVLYFLLWAGLIFVMMRYCCGMHVMGHGHHHGEAGSGDRSKDGNLHWQPPNQAVDPVCGMTVQTAGAKSAVHDGHVYYFCSQDCRQKFEAYPASYVKPMAA
jgi:YHS domain-containing protein